MNAPTSILRVALLLLAALGIGTWGWRTFGPGTGGSPPAASSAARSDANAAEPGRFVLVTYFTSNQRCPTCLKIEKLTREAVESRFAKELADGVVRFQTVNFDLPENTHFMTDYNLSFKTVVVADRRDGRERRWAKFDKVWDLVNDPEAFALYLDAGIRSYLTSDSDA